MAPLLLFILSQLTPLPQPASQLPHSVAPLPVEAGSSAYTSVNGVGVAVFVSPERSLRLGLPAQNDLWAARWDGSSVTTRLLCSDGTYSEPRIDSNGSRALILSRRLGAGLVATSIDDQLRIRSAQCAVPLPEPRSTESHQVAAVGGDYLVTYQVQGGSLLQIVWLDQQGVSVHTLAPDIGPSALPYPVEANGGGFILYRTPIGLSYVQASPRAGAVSVDGGIRAPIGGLTLARSANGPPWYSVWFTADAGLSLLMAGQIDPTSFAAAAVRTSGAQNPPAPVMAEVAGTLGIASWRGGDPIDPQLQRIPGVSRPLVPITAVPVGLAARPRPAVLAEYLGSLSLIAFSATSGELEATPPVALTMRPSHQQSINVVFTQFGWLVVWEEVAASASRTDRERTELQAALWSADQNALQPLPFSSVTPVVPLSRPRVRRRPSGALVIGLTQVDGETTLRNLTTDGQTVTIGALGLLPSLELLGFEVSDQRILRWVAVDGGTRFVNEFGRSSDLAVTLAPRGAVAANRVVVPVAGGLDASVCVVDLGLAGPPAPTIVTLNVAPQNFVSAIGAGPIDQPTRLALTVEQVDGGSGYVLYDFVGGQTQAGTAPRVVAGGAPAFLDGDFVGIGRGSGGALGSIMVPSLRGSARLDPRFEPITEVSTAASSDGGSVAVGWIAWDSTQAGLRLRFQELKWQRPAASVPDASVPDGSVSMDAGVPDAGPSGDVGIAQADGGEALVFTPACGCQPFEGGGLPAAFVLLTLAGLRRRSP